MANKIIVLASGNPHKVKEINEIAKGTGIEFVLPTGEFNPIKAKEAARISGKISLADDSGLCVEALNGEPGIYSARYAQTPQERINKLLKNLAPFGNRKAKFVCAMTLVNEKGEILHQVLGECHGKITDKQSGTNGFGYDPVFMPEGYNITMADMPEEQKNKISHRSIALNRMLDVIQNSNI